MVKVDFTYNIRAGWWRLHHAVGPNNPTHLLIGSCCFIMQNPHDRNELDACLERIGMGHVIAECAASDAAWNGIVDHALERHATLPSEVLHY